jgi:hypothetical protein
LPSHGHFYRFQNWVINSLSLDRRMPFPGIGNLVMGVLRCAGYSGIAASRHPSCRQISHLAQQDRDPTGTV